ncbi:MAG: MBL fold metallo-hydrolase [Bradyrhizobiaceae bacterium]|jgi:ribonuclease J|nr:MAG: MBL fold metallo-hydrolase [Bradyrhizobiaceae bacterium]
MRIRIHRGAHEIGGNCVEIESQGYSILLDLGLPLTADDAVPSLLPDIAGLTDGSNPHLLGIILSHTHGDHYGLTGLVHASIPIFMGAQAQTILLASRHFVPQGPLPQTIGRYRNQTPFDLGPFRITPYLADHSAFDAYSLLVEAHGKRAFYSGDIRAHGRKARLFENLVEHPPQAIDVLLLEGTTLSRPGMASAPETEQELEQRILGMINGSSGLVLASFSPQNIDRFVTIFRATKRAGRTFIADVYLAHLLDQLALPSLPKPSNGGLRVYLPDSQKRRIIADQLFDVVSRYRSARIYSEEIVASPGKWVMLFRDSMTRDIDRLPPRITTVLIYSMWPGYLDRDRSQLASWCQKQAVALEIAHTSGHAEPDSLARLAEALNPRMVVPIHTEAPQVMGSLIPNVRALRDGDWLDI